MEITLTSWLRPGKQRRNFPFLPVNFVRNLYFFCFQLRRQKEEGLEGQEHTYSTYLYTVFGLS